MDLTTAAYWVVGGLIFFELLLTGIQKFDAKDGHINYPKIGVALAYLHTGVSWLMLIPDLLPVGVKVQVPVVAAVKRYKALKAAVHVDDLPLPQWEEGAPR